ncbi:acetyltransferase [Thecamonas trahens ATCC 50062]|uniref:Acetyltransferase n=1 Tax=Thecamonas trahens ATCC 50062 TaxID=461836 RepID=A0A0L0DHI3_THETB|nr:acetyltransferase [Thecamonas trahens ATCC 50062]KNC50773.1 acetyltransferase [Thecamonas trahens ATCC 50062]|eukprot:XP_013756734.1 acetyltransferase [Thecamonas trahens ATCC 50062]
MSKVSLPPGDGFDVAGLEAVATADNVGAPVKQFAVQIRDVVFGERCALVQPCNLYECRLGDDVFVGPFSEIQAGVVIGNRTRVQSHTFVCSLVTIGDDCFIGHGVKFINDAFSDMRVAFADEAHKWEATTLGNNVLIGTNATIMPVNICDNAVIGAGSVVTSDITEPGFYMGVPAVRIGDPPPDDKRRKAIDTDDH